MASNASVATSGTKAACWGLAPNPYLRANMARSVSVALLLIFITLTLLFLLSSRLGVAHQSVNVRLDCGLLPSAHPFWELRSAQQRAHFRLCSPVQFKVGFMLRKKFPAVLRRLILLKDRSGFGILNRCGF